MVRRCGHSLPELLVTLSFLGAALGAVAAAGLGAVRATAESVRRQHAFAAAAAALDSLLGSAGPATGAGGGEGLRVEWEVDPEGAGRVVRVRAFDAESGRELAGLDGFWVTEPVAWPEDP